MSLDSYIWKTEKDPVTGVQQTIRLVDCSAEQLTKFYEHCKAMLYNDNKLFLGRYNLLTLIKEQSDNCGVELFLRESVPNNFTFMEALRTFKSNNAEILLDLRNQNKVPTIAIALNNVKEEYENLPLDLVFDGCFDRLGKLQTNHITLNFIFNQGIWFTQKELQEFKQELPNATIGEILDIVKARLLLKPTSNLKTSPKGLSYTQFRAAIKLKNTKYSELTTDQLTTLRYKLLPALENLCQLHISQWRNLMSQIEEVAKFNYIEL